MRALAGLARQGAVRLEAAGLRHSDRLWGLSSSGHLKEQGLLHILERLGPGVNELMCHPGFGDPATASRYRWGYEWEEETTALCAERVRQAVQERGVRLCHFAQAWGDGDERPV